MRLIVPHPLGSLAPLRNLYGGTSAMMNFCATTDEREDEREYLSISPDLIFLGPFLNKNFLCRFDVGRDIPFLY